MRLLFVLALLLFLLNAPLSRAEGTHVYQNTDGHVVVQTPNSRMSFPWRLWRSTSRTIAVVKSVDHKGHKFFVIEADPTHIQSWEESAGNIGTLVVRDDLQHWERLPGRGYKLSQGTLRTPSYIFNLEKFELAASPLSALLTRLDFDPSYQPSRAELEAANKPTLDETPPSKCVHIQSLLFGERP